MSVEMRTPVLTIVPRLPPSVGGVEDYGWQLALQWRQQLGIETVFLVGDPQWQAPPNAPFVVNRVEQRSPQALLSQLPGQGTVLLHYVGYGYARRGCPVWLVDGLEQWGRGRSGRILITLFHEVYATGMPWTSAFWTSPLQRHLATRLAHLSDRLLTSKQGYADLLRQLCPSHTHPIPTLPVFSTIGEPSPVLPLSQRSPWLVVFGGAGARSRVYGRSLPALAHIGQQLGIQRILDIGAPLERLPPLQGIAIESLGVLPADQISSLFSQSMVGFLDYPADFLAKSTIFAAYCAHGLFPVNAAPPSPKPDGVIAGQHYWQASDRPPSPEEQMAIAQNAYDWYQAHRLSVQAETIAQNLNLRSVQAIAECPPNPKSKIYSNQRVD